MRTRFAPSPTGPLHLGHAYAAIFAHDLARRHGGEFHLRIEDIDRERSRPEWEQAIYEDLRWLGLSWETPVMRQSDRLPAYTEVLDQLWSRGLLYPCSCTRRDISDALSAPQEGTHVVGPDGLVYPGTCRPNGDRCAADLTQRPTNAHLRLNMQAAINAVMPLSAIAFHEIGAGPTGECGPVMTTAADLTQTIGDVVLARREFGTSYHLSVVIDDAAQGITHVTRGNDLFDATRIHVLLQMLLELPTPIYCHHAIIRDENGKRLAKRDDARSIAAYRRDGATPSDIRHMVGF